MNRIRLTIVLIILLLLLSLARGHIIASIIGQSPDRRSDLNLECYGVSPFDVPEEAGQVSISVEASRHQDHNL
jgi:hypothetical protein